MPAPGISKTSQLLLSTATVMIGPLADLHNLHPLTHSLGLVKNVQLNLDPGYTEMGQGIQNDIVMSVKTSESVRIGFEVYEFTLRNLGYAATLDASGVAYDPITLTYTTTVAPTGVTVTCTVAPAGIVAGDLIYIQNIDDDIVHIAKVSSITTTVITLVAGYSIPAAMVFSAGSRVGKVKKLQIGGGTNQPDLACKIVGLMPKDAQPITILMPRMKITKGLGMSFQNDQFSNMPFELTPYAGLPADPFYTEYGASKMVLLGR